MSEQIEVNVIAYCEEPSKHAEAIATFAYEDLYDACAPVIEEWIAKNFSPEYVLTESCGHRINVEIAE